MYKNHLVRYYDDVTGIIRIGYVSQEFPNGIIDIIPTGYIRRLSDIPTNLRPICIHEHDVTGVIGKLVATPQDTAHLSAQLKEEYPVNHAIGTFIGYILGSAVIAASLYFIYRSTQSPTGWIEAIAEISIFIGGLIDKLLRFIGLS